MPMPISLSMLMSRFLKGGVQLIRVSMQKGVQGGSRFGANVKTPTLLAKKGGPDPQDHPGIPWRKNTKIQIHDSLVI